MPASVLLSLTGHDRPGVTRTLFETLPPEVEVLDVEQVVVDGLLSLGVVLGVSDAVQVDQLRSVVAAAVGPMGITVSAVMAEAADAARPTHPNLVTVLGAPLTAAAMAGLAQAVAAAGANIDRVERIAAYPVTALELQLSGADLPSLRQGLGQLSHATGVDIAVQAGGLGRRGRQLVVMDVDSTVIQDEVVELLAAKAGVEAEVKRITESAMRGELDFAESLRERVGLLAGLPERVLADVYGELRLTPGARTLCRALKSMDYRIALVSGGFTQVVAPLADSLGVDYWRANLLEVEGGRLTGRISGEIVDRAGKAAALRAFAAEAGIPMSRTIAIGDGANDLDMIAAANLGIAFNAKPIVQASADAAVNFPYLDSVLYLLGIRRSEVEQHDLADS